MSEAEDRSQISDGYHTFAELYEHRHALFVALCAHWPTWKGAVWRAQHHSDGTMFPGWFIAGIGREPGKQITYHLPDQLWGKLDFAETFLRAPEWDGHTPADVVRRLWNVIGELE
jgi:hypothetical protein